MATNFVGFLGFFNTDVGVGFGFLKYRDIGFGFRLPTRLYYMLQQQSQPNKQTALCRHTHTHMHTHSQAYNNAGTCPSNI